MKLLEKLRAILLVWGVMRDVPLDAGNPWEYLRTCRGGMDAGSVETLLPVLVSRSNAERMVATLEKLEAVLVSENAEGQ